MNCIADIPWALYCSNSLTCFLQIYRLQLKQVMNENKIQAVKAKRISNYVWQDLLLSNYMSQAGRLVQLCSVIIIMIETRVRLGWVLLHHTRMFSVFSRLEFGVNSCILPPWVGFIFLSIVPVVRIPNTAPGIANEPEKTGEKTLMKNTTIKPNLDISTFNFSEWNYSL